MNEFTKPEMTVIVINSDTIVCSCEDHYCFECTNCDTKYE